MRRSRPRRRATTSCRTRLALPLAGAIAATATVVAIRWRSQVIAGIGLLGAALAPALQAIDTEMTWESAAFAVIVLAAVGVGGGPARLARAPRVRLGDRRRCRSSGWRRSRRRCRPGRSPSPPAFVLCLLAIAVGRQIVSDAVGVDCDSRSGTRSASFGRHDRAGGRSCFDEPDRSRDRAARRRCGLGARARRAAVEAAARSRGCRRRLRARARRRRDGRPPLRLRADAGVGGGGGRARCARATARRRATPGDWEPATRRSPPVHALATDGRPDAPVRARPPTTVRRCSRSPPRRSRRRRRACSPRPGTSPVPRPGF